MEKYNDIQQIKRRFFAMRNGVTADSLRSAGTGYRYIFGLNLPQLAEIAAETGLNDSLAIALSDDTLCRESQLLAPMLYTPEHLTAPMALKWISKATTIEVIDILCHRLLRKSSHVSEIIESTGKSEDPMLRYAAIRLACNVVYTQKGIARTTAIAMTGDSDARVARVARQILDELEFMN